MSDTKKTAPAENYADLGDFSISSRGMAKDIIKRFMRNKTAVVGLFYHRCADGLRPVPGTDFRPGLCDAPSGQCVCGPVVGAPSRDG